MIVAIIQARMGSSRLPGKVMLDLCGKPVLWHVQDRVSRAGTIDKIVIATSKEHDDDTIENFCKYYNIPFFRGDEQDVLKRYYGAVTMLKKAGCDIDFIVRITADCPLIDPEVIDQTVSHAVQGKFDYVTTSNPPSFPDGVDVEVFTPRALEIASKNAKLPSEREHVTQYIIKHKQFRKSNVKNPRDLSKLRWSLDEKEDYKFMQIVYAELYRKSRVVSMKKFSMKKILTLLEKKPELTRINAHILINEGYQKSLLEDKKILEEIKK